jgi:hypothetical protein
MLCWQLSHEDDLGRQGCGDVLAGPLAGLVAIQQQQDAALVACLSQQRELAGGQLRAQERDDYGEASLVYAHGVEWTLYHDQRVGAVQGQGPVPVEEELMLGQAEG